MESAVKSNPFKPVRYQDMGQFTVFDRADSTYAAVVLNLGTTAEMERI